MARLMGKPSRAKHLECVLYVRLPLALEQGVGGTPTIRQLYPYAAYHPALCARVFRGGGSPAIS